MISSCSKGQGVYPGQANLSPEDYRQQERHRLQKEHLPFGRGSDNLDSVLSLAQRYRSVTFFGRHGNLKNYIKQFRACIFIKYLLWDDVTGTIEGMGAER